MAAAPKFSPRSRRSSRTARSPGRTGPGSPNSSGLRNRPLGPGAPAVSAVGFGGMHLSIQGRPSREQAVRVLHAALDAGITFIDTADVYCLDDGDIGHNERLIAEALRSWRG